MDIGGIGVAAAKFIEVANNGLFLLAHSAKETRAAEADLAAREGERQAATSVEEIVEATGQAHVASWNVAQRLEFEGIIRDLVSDSVEAACGALLQLAKQAISRAHGAPDNWPAGRAVGRQSIRDIILQARNQSAHSDEGDYRPVVLRVFELLEADFGPQLHLEAGLCVSRALAVVRELGWLEPTKFMADLSALSSREHR